MNFGLKPSTAVGRAVLQQLKLSKEPPPPDRRRPSRPPVEREAEACSPEPSPGSYGSLLHSRGQRAWGDFTRTLSKKHVEGMQLTLHAELPGGTVEELLEVLQQGSEEDRREAAAFLRERCSESDEVRLSVVEAGGVGVLEVLAHSSEDPTIVEAVVTALHNLALSREAHPHLMRSGVLAAIVHVLQTGTPMACSNAAATIFLLSRNLSHAEVIVEHQGLYRPLVDLLQGPHLRGKKDAAYAMCYISLVAKGRRALIQAGAVEALVAILSDGVEGMEEKAVAVLNNIAKGREGTQALIDAEAVDVLGELLASQSARSKEDATSALLQVARHNEVGCRLVRDAGLVGDLLPITFSSSVTPKGQQKAKALIQLLRSKREVTTAPLRQLSGDSTGSGEFQLSFSGVQSR